MPYRRRKAVREKDLTDELLSGGNDEDRMESQQRFSSRSKHRQSDKTQRTTLMRAAELAADVDVETLPTGQVVQVYSLFCEVEREGSMYLCVIRKTLAQTSQTSIVVGDFVRFRETPARDELGRTEAVIEQVLPRKTVLTRASSFDGRRQDPIVANAEQLFIVASLVHPRIKWGVIDRMIVAAKSGGLLPIICLNKIDLAVSPSPDAAGTTRASSPSYKEARAEARLTANPTENYQRALDHYQSLGIPILQTSVPQSLGLDRLRELLKDKTTVLAGHSGVGKSSLISAIQPHIDLRIGAVSTYTEKGRHTTSSAQRYPLDFGGQVIDTPGIKHFGLWNLTPDNLLAYFPDIEAGTAPPWRAESYQRILDSLS